MLHGDAIRVAGGKRPGTEELRKAIGRLKSPHIIEGVQVMGLRPEEVEGHDLRIIEPSRRAVVGRLMRRGWNPATGVPRYDREGAGELYDEMSQNLAAFKRRFSKEAALKPKPGEFAPGIPAARKILPIPKVKKTEPQTWGMATQLHEAERAGRHIDLRLVDQAGKAHSWALPKAELPKPGEKVLVVQQPTHTAEYAARKGSFLLPEGYGKGKVTGSGLQPVEVVSRRPGLLRFNVYGGRGAQEYAIVNTPKGQLLHNFTVTQESGGAWRRRPRDPAVEAQVQGNAGRFRLLQ